MARRDNGRTTKRANLPEARVAFAHIVPEEDLLAVANRTAVLQELRSSLRPGEAITRYNKTWRMARWTEDNGYIFGRIGFQREIGRTEVWDDRIQDFVAQAMRGGQTSPFAIRLSNRRVVFQLRSNEIERGSFTGALQALLNEASKAYKWRVLIDRAEVPWEIWIESVERVTKLAVTVRAPNPDYQGKDEIEDLLEHADAEVARIVLEAGPGGINLTASDIVRQAIAHADAGHGSYRAEGIRRGRRRRELRTTWDSSEVLPSRRVTATEDREAPHSALRRELEAGTPELGHSVPSAEQRELPSTGRPELPPSTETEG